MRAKSRSAVRIGIDGGTSPAEIPAELSRLLPERRRLFEQVAAGEER